MGKCNMDTLLNMVGENKLTKQTEVTFTLHQDLPDCRKISARNYVEANEGVSFNKFERPINRFECMRNGCVNTGTLNGVVNAVYYAPYDAEEFAAGVITFYVKPSPEFKESNGSITVKVFVSNSPDIEKDKNYDQYTVTIFPINVMDDGFVPVFVDLSKEPTATVGSGWVAISGGAYINIVTTQNEEPTLVGISSINIFESIFDFEVNDTVKVSCLSEIGGSFDVDALEATCLQAGYDDGLSSLEYAVTGNKVTPNYWKLNPLMGKGERTEGYFPNTVEKTVISNGLYGYVRLPDVADECGYFAVEIADECNVTDSYLKQLSIPAFADIDEGHFYVVRNSLGTTDIVVNKVFIGKNIKIAYPQAVTIEEETVANTDNLGSVRVRMTVPRTLTDGTRYLLVFDNVLVTSFPATINTEETEFNFTLTIQRDKDGNFFRRQRISVDGVTTPTYDAGHI